MSPVYSHKQENLKYLKTTMACKISDVFIIRCSYHVNCYIRRKLNTKLLKN